jgi:hypothetical protein
MVPRSGHGSHGLLLPEITNGAWGIALVVGTNPTIWTQTATAHFPRSTVHGPLLATRFPLQQAASHFHSATATNSPKVRLHHLRPTDLCGRQTLPLPSWLPSSSSRPRLESLSSHPLRPTAASHCCPLLPSSFGTRGPCTSGSDDSLPTNLGVKYPVNPDIISVRKTTCNGN